MEGKKKCFDGASLRQLAESVNGEVSALSEAVASAMAEEFRKVYQEIGALEARLGSYTYVAGEEKIILPQPAAAGAKEAKEGQ